MTSVRGRGPLAALCCATALALPIAAADAADCPPAADAESRVQWRADSADPSFERIIDGLYIYSLPEAAQERCLARERRRASKQDRPATSPLDEEPASRCEAQRAICFHAVRFDPGRVSLDLLDVVETVNESPKTERGVHRGDTDQDQGLLPVQYSLKTLSEVLGGDAFALTNAGWNSGVDIPEPIGFHEIDGRVLQPELYPGLSTILCLDDAIGGDGLPKIYYHTQSGAFTPENWDDAQRTAISRCQNTLQVGPRIVEEDNRLYVHSFEDVSRCMSDLTYVGTPERKKLGICETSLNRPLRLRTVLVAESAASGPGRLTLLTTTTPASLYDLQWLFLHSGIHSRERLLWAVNLSGHHQAAFILQGAAGTFVKAGNLDRSIATALLLRRR